jgi:hypothetical protein
LFVIGQSAINGARRVGAASRLGDLAIAVTIPIAVTVPIAISSQQVVAVPVEPGSVPCHPGWRTL